MVLYPLDFKELLSGNIEGKFHLFIYMRGLPRSIEFDSPDIFVGLLIAIASIKQGAILIINKSLPIERILKIA